MIELAPRTLERMDYDEAMLHCYTCTHDNKYDWRIPTAAEYKRSRCVLSWHETRYMFLDPEYHVTPVRTNNMIEFAPEANERMEYDEAWLYCATLTHNSKYDWRLPTYKEYNSSKLIRTWYEDRPDDKLPDRYVTPVRTDDRTSP